MTCQDSFHEVAFNISFWTRNISSARILFWRGVYTIRKNDGTIFVRIPLKGQLKFCFFPIYFDSYISAYSEWICAKFFTKDTQYQKKHWYNLCVHTLIGGAAILFFKNSFDIHILASVAQNRLKFYMKYMYSKR